MNDITSVLLFCACWTSTFEQGGSASLNNPCDIQRNASVSEVLPTGYAERATYYLIIGYPDWMTTQRRFVNCSNRGLTRVPTNMPSNVEILFLNGNFIHEFYASDFESMPNLVALFIRYNCVKISSIDLPHCNGHATIEPGALRSLFKLKMLVAFGTVMKHFPQRLPATLEFLDIGGTAIERVTKADLANLRNLSVFSVRDMCADTYPPECSKNLTIEEYSLTSSRESLQVLDLSTTWFCKVPVHLLTPKLLSLDLSESNITLLENDDFAGIPLVKALHLYMMAGDWTLRVQPKVFYPLTDLEYLNFASNMIEYFPNGTFLYNTKLFFLDLSLNCLWKYVEDPTFVPPQSIKYLFLGNNRVCDYVPKHTIQTLRFGLSYSKMKHLVLLSLGHQTQIELDLAVRFQLNISKVDHKSFHALNQLEMFSHLKMGYCNIVEFDVTSLSSLKHLNQVYLSHNGIYNRKVSSVGPSATKDYYHKRSINIGADTSSRSRRVLRNLFSRDFTLFKKFPTNPIMNQQNCNNQFRLDLSFNELEVVKSDMFTATTFVQVLDLSQNIILHIYDHAFSSLPLLCRLDLRGNPIRYVDPDSFSGLNHFRYFAMDSKQIIQSYTSFKFLTALKHPYGFRYTSSGNIFFNLMVAPGYSTFCTQYVESVDFSNNKVLLNIMLYDVFRNFPNVTSITMNSCELFDVGHLPTPLVTYLDFSQNAFHEIPHRCINKMPLLNTFKLASNKIEELPEKSFAVVSKLQYIDLSFNRIRYIGPGVFHGFSNLSVLLLQNNYITRGTHEVFPITMLSRLQVLDLRRNPISCTCALTKNFGRWFKGTQFNLNARPGFFNTCTVLIEEFYDGCVQCESSASLQTESLLSFSMNRNCQSFRYFILTTAFTGSLLIFLVAGIVFSSERWKVWLARYANKAVSVSYESRLPKGPKSVFAFHACVIFDRKSQNVVVNGRDDHCGFSPVKQLLAQIDSSRVVILVLTGNYGNTCKGKYIISVLEYLKFQSGKDKVVIVTFEGDAQSGGFVRNRLHRRSRSPLQLPASTSLWPMFWDNLRHQILNFDEEVE
ncbi:toll-like receptor 8 [Clavelina lepadiformis]|uniref:toll-like receptor 8 n=1 Tax=Clavelina lepadiformis TaxID=159417 RepID=UPI004042E86C